MAYTCQNCGAEADKPGHLCNPSSEGIDCKFCGEKDVAASHVCKSKLASLKYSCESCGRLAMDSAHLCKPAEIV
ncbi:hypothetical protein [Desulfopila sp. IMCC35008]|uniref:hypothetical protein n=1 Tax=Desulfopila sp. IMCC35008 TaxID=2653858 RepID=UPI0013D61F39|nr:hypothetical protein [Desulfopila sp. IMCC35008]